MMSHSSGQPPLSAIDGGIYMYPQMHELKVIVQVFENACMRDCTFPHFLIFYVQVSLDSPKALQTVHYFFTNYSANHIKHHHQLLQCKLGPGVHHQHG